MNEFIPNNLDKNTSKTRAEYLGQNDESIVPVTKSVFESLKFLGHLVQTVVLPWSDLPSNDKNEVDFRVNQKIG